MIRYVIYRLFLIVPTVLIIVIVNFAIAQAVPGGPVEQAIARFSGAAGGAVPGGTSTAQAAPSGMDPKLLNELRVRYGYDKPPIGRLKLMLVSYAHLDFGQSFYLGEPVTQLIHERLPVSLSLGLWTTVLSYLLAIPVGIHKAMRQGSRFDLWTSTGIGVAYAMPTFLFAILLMMAFSGGFGINLFPIRGLVSDNFGQLSAWGKVRDYAWHMAMPVASLTIGAFAMAAIVTKNAFLGEISKQYVVTARSKGMTEGRILYRHVFRNAALLLLTTIPQTFIAVFLGGSLLIETLFSLDGFGRLSYEAALSRDYPVVFGSLFVFSVAGMLIKLLGDVAYMIVDPRIDLAARAE
ncbi:ABC transporter permease subunit [Burkholderia pyrrocinia]|uniref:ABC transporter permease subunit n=1 Tax=Burkholderia pyrrocinia TaxID=60550 RepID=UPI002AAF8168|nr:ABC transporter permease subunit [Burkholderia pyrrocinia]